MARMNVEQMIHEIDAEIEHLQAARAALAGLSSKTPTKRSSRPAKKVTAKRTATKKRNRVLSPEARERIAAAQRKRWAAAKKA